MWYQIEYLQKGEDGIYSYLPIFTQVTDNKTTALKWFDDVMHHYSARSPWYTIKEVVERELDYLCCIKQAHIVCEEPAHTKGDYLVELKCYDYYNPTLY